MKKLVGAFALVMLLGAMLTPASASHQTYQKLANIQGTSSLGLGLDGAGLATAVYDATDDSWVSVRKAGSKFGPGVKLDSGLVYNEMAFSQSDNGNAIAVVDDGTEMRAAVRIGASNGFGPMRRVSNTATGPPILPTAVMSNSGRAAMAWLESPANDVYASIYQGGSWTSPELIDSGDQLDSPQLGADAAGNLLLVWVEQGGGTPAIHGATSAAGDGTFEAPETIETLDYGDGAEPRLAVNEAGDAVLTYSDAVETSVCGVDCSFFWHETRYGNVDGTFAEPEYTPTNGEAGWGAGSAEPSIDDNGVATVLFSMTVKDVGPSLIARVSDTNGTLGSVQSIDATFSDGDEMFASDGGGGEFTAVWIDGDTVFEATTSSGTFGAAHMLAGPGLTFVDEAAVARNDSGAHVSGWVDDVMPHAGVVGTGPILIQGTETSDTINGTNGPDTANLEAGNDTFNGRGGNDKATGEEGSDKINGGGGADNLDGGAGGDVLTGGPANDTLKGGGGNDRLDGSKGKTNKNILDGGAGKDTCIKRSRKDVLRSCEKVVKRF